jgi:predicted KAP-like P-loop ATPase
MIGPELDEEIRAQVRKTVFVPGRYFRSAEQLIEITMEVYYELLRAKERKLSEEEIFWKAVEAADQAGLEYDRGHSSFHSSVDRKRDIFTAFLKEKAEREAPK